MTSSNDGRTVESVPVGALASEDPLSPSGAGTGNATWRALAVHADMKMSVTIHAKSWRPPSA